MPTHQFLRSRAGATLAILLLALAGALGLFERIERALLPEPLVAVAEGRVQESMTRAAALFATARALNAAVSVLQSSEVSGSVVVAQGTISPGQALDPVNDLVERFSALMLTATVALGGSLLLLQAGDMLGLAVLLPAGLLLTAAALWLGGPVGGGAGRAGRILLAAALVAKIGLPLTVLATEAVADRIVEPRIVAAEARLEGLDVPNVDQPAATQGWLERWKTMSDITGQVARMAAAAADIADLVIELTIAYAVKLVVLPLITLWLVARMAEVLIAALVPRGSG